MADKGVAVVTGGASGIGEATAERFARDGYAIAILDMNEAQGKVVAQRIVNDGGKALLVRCDVADLTSVESAPAAWRTRSVRPTCSSRRPA